MSKPDARASGPPISLSAKGRTGTTLLVVTRGGKKVTAVGIGDKRLTKSKKLTKKLLTAWKLG